LNRISVIASHLFPTSENKVDNLSVEFTSAGYESKIKQSKQLDGDVAIITGSGQGIGLAAALLFASHGCKIVVTDIDATKSDAAAKLIKEKGVEAISIPGDITDPEFPQKLVDQTLKTLGKINHIVNNAGYTWDVILHKMTDKQWEKIIEVHNTAPFRLVRAAANHMRETAKAEIEKYGAPQQNIHCQCFIDIWTTWKCRTSQLLDSEDGGCGVH